MERRKGNLSTNTIKGRRKNYIIRRIIYYNIIYNVYNIIYSTVQGLEGCGASTPAQTHFTSHIIHNHIFP